MIVFNQLPNIGLEFMNIEHQQAADLFNKIETDFKRHDVDAVIAGILEIQQHCIEHFAHEEREMKTYEYPPYNVHKQAHDRVLMEIDMVVKQLQSHRTLSKISSYIEHGFPSWFSHHLATMDKVTAEFILSQQAVKSA